MKTNIIEIIFIILTIVFFGIMMSIIVLEEFEIINTGAGQCSDSCELRNQTFSNYREGVCTCCDSILEKFRGGTTIETNCVQINSNES